MTDKALYSSIEQDEGPGPCRCIHEEAQEDQIYDLFSEFGQVKNLHANLDRKSGYLKGYSLVEFNTLPEAQKAVNELNGSSFMGKTISVNFAFKKASSENEPKRSKK